MDLILVRGVSGAGKSTIADMMDWLGHRTVSFSTDDMFMVDGNYEFDPSLLGENHAATVQKVRDVMIARYEVKIPETIIVHNTFTEEWEMKPYFELAEDFNWRVHTIIVENRHGSKSIHDVPDDVIKDQKERFEVIL